jgi:sulfopyruvate decarboxylase subunit beta
MARMIGLEALKLLSRRRTNEIVIMHESNRADWPVATTRPELDYLMAGAMGKASSFTLGLALGRPDAGFWVLDGDGALLMNLGSLVTIAAQRPANLLHIVYNNDTYDTTGGQPTPGSGNVNFEGLARDAGYASAFTFSDLETLDGALDEVLAAPRPAMLVLRIESNGRRPTAPGLRRSAEALTYLKEYLAQSVLD